jgi:hypothetical protein
MRLLHLAVEITCWWSTLIRLGISRIAAAELIGMDDLWDIVFSRQPGQEGFRRFGVAVSLKQDVEHEPVLVHGPP